MTDPTADAAKLLPCPFCGGAARYQRKSLGQFYDYIVECAGDCECVCRGSSKSNAIALWNTRPQPAPPEGEPVAWAVKDFADGWIIYAHEAHARRQAELTGARIERLGLAARPKVEDADAAVSIKNIRAFAEKHVGIEQIGLRHAADLLERLAGDLQNWRSVAIVAMTAEGAAEAKLTEREVELAKADAVIEGMSIGLAGAPTEWSDSDSDAAMKRHAARQQQKDSDEFSRG